MQLNYVKNYEYETVGDLIEILSAFPKDAVISEDYSEGYNGIIEVTEAAEKIENHWRD